MKIILVIMSLLFSYVVVAQTDEETPKNAKPSWSSKMPDRNDAPQIDTEEEDDAGLSGFEMDRSSLFNDDVDTSLVTDDSSETITTEESQRTIALERQAEADRIAEQDRQIEAARVAEQDRQIEAAKTTELKQQTEADSIAKQEKITEDQKRAAEKRDLEQQITANNQINTTEGVLESNPQIYNWKKIKNTAPEYPTKAARDGKEGWVDVEFTINNSGTVIGAHPVKTYKNSKLFNKAALRAVRHWKYDPPIKYGIKLNQTKIVRIVFNLAN